MDRYIDNNIEKFNAYSCRECGIVTYKVLDQTPDGVLAWKCMTCGELGPTSTFADEMA